MQRFVFSASHSTQTPTCPTEVPSNKKEIRSRDERGVGELGKDPKVENRDGFLNHPLEGSAWCTPRTVWWMPGAYLRECGLQELIPDRVVNFSAHPPLQLQPQMQPQP